MPQADNSPQLPPLPPKPPSLQRRRNSSADSADSDSELVHLPPGPSNTKVRLHEIPIPDQLYSDMDIQLPPEIPLPAPDTSSRYSPSHVLGAEEEEEVTSPSDRKKSVLGKAQAKKRLLAFSAAKAAASPTSTLSVSSTSKKPSPLKPLGTKQKQEPVLAIQTIKEEETQMKKMIAMNSLLADKLHQVKLIATAVPSIPEISTITTTQAQPPPAESLIPPQTAIVKPLPAVSEPTVDSSSRAGPSRRTIKKSKRRHSSTSQSSARSRSPSPRPRSPADRKSGKKRSKKTKSRSRSRSKERERKSKKSRRSRSKERERKVRRSLSKSRSPSYDSKRPSRTKRRDEYSVDRRERERRRRSEERGVKRSKSPLPASSKGDRNTDVVRIRKSRMPENWEEYKTMDYNVGDINQLWIQLRDKQEPTRDRSRSTSPADHDPSSAFEQPTKLSKSLQMPPTTCRLVLNSGLVGEYPLHLIHKTKTQPQLNFGYNRLSVKGYFKTRQQIYEDEDPEIVREMDTIVQETSNDEPSPDLDRSRKSSERPWYCPSEETWVASEGTKGVVISHLYSEDEESKSPFPVMKDDVEEMLKESSEESDDQSIDSTPSPLLKQRYAQLEDEPPSPLLHKTVPVKPFEVPPPTISPHSTPQQHHTDTTDVEEVRERKKKEKKKRKIRKRQRTSSDEPEPERHRRKRGKKHRKSRGEDSSSSEEEEERKSKKKSKKGRKRRAGRSPSSDADRDGKPPPGGSAGRNEDPPRNEEKEKRKEKKEGSSHKRREHHQRHHSGGRRKQICNPDELDFDADLTFAPVINGFKTEDLFLKEDDLFVSKSEDVFVTKRDVFEGEAAQLDPEAQQIISSLEDDEFFQLLSKQDEKGEDSNSQEGKTEEIEAVEELNEATPVVEELNEAIPAVEQLNDAEEEKISEKTQPPPMKSDKEQVKCYSKEEVRVERVRSREREVRGHERSRRRSRSRTPEGRRSRSRTPDGYRSYRSSRYHHSSHYRRRSDSEERERHYRYRRHYHHRHHSYTRRHYSRSPVERVRRNPKHSPPLQLNVADSTISDAELDEQLKPSPVSPSLASSGGTPKVEWEQDEISPSKRSGGFSSPPRRLSLDERLEREMGIKLTEDVVPKVAPLPYYMQNGKIPIPPPPLYLNHPNGFLFPPPPPPNRGFGLRGPPPIPPYWPPIAPPPVTTQMKPKQSTVIQIGDMLRVLPAEIPTEPIVISCAAVLGDRTHQLLNGQVKDEVVKRVVRIKVPVVPFEVPIAQPQGLTEEEKSIRRKRRRAERKRMEQKAKAVKETKEDEVSAEEMALLKEAISESFEGEEELRKSEDVFPAESQVVPPAESQKEEEAGEEDVKVDLKEEVEGQDGVTSRGQVEDVVVWGVGPVPILPPPETGILVPFGLRPKSGKKRVTFADGINPGCGGSESCGEEMTSPPPPPSYPYKKSVAKDKGPPKKKKIKVKVLRNKKPKVQPSPEPPPPPPSSYPFCPIGILYQVCPKYAVLYAETMAEQGFDIVFEPSTQHPYADQTQGIVKEVEVNPPAGWTPFPPQPPAQGVSRIPTILTASRNDLDCSAIHFEEIQPRSPQITHRPLPHQNPNLRIVSPTKNLPRNRTVGTPSFSQNSNLLVVSPTVKQIRQPMRHFEPENPNLRVVSPAEPPQKCYSPPLLPPGDENPGNSHISDFFVSSTKNDSPSRSSKIPEKPNSNLVVISPKKQLELLTPPSEEENPNLLAVTRTQNERKSEDEQIPKPSPLPENPNLVRICSSVEVPDQPQPVPPPEYFDSALPQPEAIFKSTLPQPEAILKSALPLPEAIQTAPENPNLFVLSPTKLVGIPVPVQIERRKSKPWARQGSISIPLSRIAAAKGSGPQIPVDKLYKDFEYDFTPAPPTRKAPPEVGHLGGFHHVSRNTNNIVIIPTSNSPRNSSP